MCFGVYLLFVSGSGCTPTEETKAAGVDRGVDDPAEMDAAAVDMDGVVDADPMLFEDVGPPTVGMDAAAVEMDAAAVEMDAAVADTDGVVDADPILFNDADPVDPPDVGDVPDPADVGLGDDAGPMVLDAAPGADDAAEDPPDAAPLPLDAAMPPLPACDLPAGPVVHIASGAEGGDGSAARPFGRVDEGLAVLVPGGGVARLMMGVYDETVVLPDGVHLVGGFDGEWLPGGGETLIRGGTDGAGRAVGVMAEDVECGALEEVSITTVAAAPGASAYGIVARRSPGLQLQTVNITTGPGGDGVAGGDGAAGDDGSDGHDARIVRDKFDCFHRLAGGQGGGNEACAGNRGGRGENMEQAPQASGVSASVFAACHGAEGAMDCPEAFGVYGPPGGPGRARVDLTPEEGWWPASPGRSGGAGQAHYGAGGGLARGRAGDGQILVGGGGGGGGCGGAGGAGGAGGGSAFGLFVLESPGLRVRNTRITSGDGGQGGEGGRGGVGGAGGRMGDGLTCRYVRNEVFDCDFMGVRCESRASDLLAQSGGDGGDGGRGADGVSLGAHCSGGAIDVDDASVLSAGVGGQSEAHFGCCVTPPDAEAACADEGGVYDAARCRCAPRAGCTGLAEICNGRDDDCDGLVDEASLGPPQLLIRTPGRGVLSDAAHWEGDGVVFLSVHASANESDPLEREPGLLALQIGEDGGFVDGWARVDYRGESATTLSGAVGPSGPALTVSEFDEEVDRFTFGPEGARRLPREPGLNYHNTHGGPGGVIDVVAAGRHEFDPPEVDSLWWRRLTPALEPAFAVETNDAVDGLERVRGSAALGDAMYFLAVDRAGAVGAQGDTIRWIRLDRDGAVVEQRMRREASVWNVHLLSIDEDTLVAAWSERTDAEVVTVYARLVGEGAPELAVAGAGRPLGLVADPAGEGILLYKLQGEDLAYGRIGDFGYGAERVVAGVFAGYGHVGLIRVGEGYGLILRSGEGLSVRVGPLCSPRGI